MGIKDYFRKLKEDNANYYATLDSGMNTSSPEEPQLVTENADASEPQLDCPSNESESSETSKEGVITAEEFEQMKASLVERNNALEEELISCRQSLSNLKNYQAENERLRQHLKSERSDNRRLRSELQREEYEELSLRTTRLMGTLTSLESQIKRKTVELDDLENKLADIKKELKDEIKKRTSHEDITFRVAKGHGELYRTYAELHNESLSDFIKRAIEEAINSDDVSQEKSDLSLTP